MGLVAVNRPKKIREHRGDDVLPESASARRSDEKEIAASALHLLSQPANQMGLPGTSLTTDHHTERPGCRRLSQVRDGVGDPAAGVGVHTLDVDRRGLPHVFEVIDPVKPQGGDGFQFADHAVPINSRWLSCSPIRMAASRSAAVRAFWSSSGTIHTSA